MEREILSRIEGLLAQIAHLLRPRHETMVPPEQQRNNPRLVVGSVTIREQPLSVAQAGNWNVAISNEPLSVAQAGNWSVAISGQPIQVSEVQPARHYAIVSANTAGNTTVVNAITGKRIRVVAYTLVASGDVTVQWRSGATTPLSGEMRLVTAGGVATSFEGGLFQTGVGEALILNLSAAVTVGGHLTYEEIA